MSGWVALSLVLAFAVWGHPRDCQRVGVRMAPLTHTAEARGCRIIYSSTPARRWTWTRTCSATIHEWGHLVGRGHSTNPRSIMFPRLTNDRRCRGFGLPYLRARLRK